MKNYTVVTEIEVKEKLGGGAFGDVYRGTLCLRYLCVWMCVRVRVYLAGYADILCPIFNSGALGIWQGTTPVALKKLKDAEHVKEFIREADILWYVALDGDGDEWERAATLVYLNKQDNYIAPDTRPVQLTLTPTFAH